MYHMAVVARLERTPITAARLAYSQEAVCRHLIGAVADHLREHHEHTTVEDVLTIATLVERNR